uniref:Protein kinase domain-containing protein n=1 Tax=Meloidogyne hapla TaxID=6305 RepID=A0A1I8AYR3_MELHA
MVNPAGYDAKVQFPITALREIKMLKLLRHPNITELIDVCTCKRTNNFIFKTSL